MLPPDWLLPFEPVELELSDELLDGAAVAAASGKSIVSLYMWASDGVELLE